MTAMADVSVIVAAGDRAGSAHEPAGINRLFVFPTYVPLRQPQISPDRA